MIAELKKIWPWIAVVVVAIFLVGRSQFQAEDVTGLAKETHALTIENGKLVTSLQRAIVESCQVNGNAARKVSRETITEELHEAEHPDPGVIRALDLPPALLDRLTHENIDRLTSRLNRLHKVDCAAQYHISPGSGAERRRVR